mmetsp:Transcript_86469/g.209676  ORF Transcript_86469/g.209676 Transcript_86469/m.209676 type:complete len:327 (-) Transcript_86469:284-1264(-)
MRTSLMQCCQECMRSVACTELHAVEVVVRMHAGVQRLVVVEAHILRLGGAVHGRPVGGDHRPLHLLHRGAPLLRHADARVLELLVVDLALPSVLDLVEDDVGVGRGEGPREQHAVLAELGELPAVQVRVALAEGVEGLLHVMPGQLVLAFVPQLLGVPDALGARPRHLLRVAGAVVVLVEDMLAGVRGLVVVEAHEVGLRGVLLHAQLLPLRHRRLHGPGRHALLLGDAPDAVLKLAEVHRVLAPRLVLREHDVHVVLGELPVEELAIDAELLEVFALKPLIQACVALVDRLAVVPEACVLAVCADRVHGRQALVPALRGAGLAAL